MTITVDVKINVSDMVQQLGTHDHALLMDGIECKESDVLFVSTRGELDLDTMTGELEPSDVAIVVKSILMHTQNHDDFVQAVRKEVGLVQKIIQSEISQ